MKIQKYLASGLTLALVVGLQAETLEMRTKKTSKNELSQIWNAHKEAIVVGATATVVGLGLTVGAYYTGRSKGKKVTDTIVKKVVGIGSDDIKKLENDLDNLRKDYEKAGTSENKKYLDDRIELINKQKSELLEKDKDKNEDAIKAKEKEIAALDKKLAQLDELKELAKGTWEAKAIAAAKVIEEAFYDKLAKEIEDHKDNVHNKVFTPEEDKGETSKK